MPDKVVFPHKCVTPGCPITVQFDDEPWCFTHSPDEGSSLRGYSARRAAQSFRPPEMVTSEDDMEKNEYRFLVEHPHAVQSNVFEDKEN